MSRTRRRYRKRNQQSRCRHCGKVCYGREKEAWEVAIQHGYRAYFDKECGWWHITSQVWEKRKESYP